MSVLLLGLVPDLYDGNQQLSILGLNGRHPASAGARGSSEPCAVTLSLSLSLALLP
jgi:hypothetical protein